MKGAVKVYCIYVVVMITMNDTIQCEKRIPQDGMINCMNEVFKVVMYYVGITCIFLKCLNGILYCITSSIKMTICVYD